MVRSTTKMFLVGCQRRVIEARKNDRQVFVVELPNNLHRHLDSSIERVVVNPCADRWDRQTADLMFENEGEDAFIAPTEKVWFPSLSI